MADPSDRGEGRFAGRVRRYARVGASVGGLAAKAAGARYLGLGLDRESHAHDLARALGGLKGPLMKVAQLLAAVPDMLPGEYVTHLAGLQSNAPPMGWAFVKRRMAAELGPDWRGRFAEFSHQAAAAASLGQVHRARSLEGRDLACKLQYPDMGTAVEADLKQLKLIFGLYHRYDPTIDASEIHAELSERLREELDYVREARHIALYHRMLDGEPGIHLPEVDPDLSSRRLLTMTWLEGVPLMTCKEAPQAMRDAIARNLFRAWYRPLYRFGVIHGDPHPGNYSVREDGSLNLLDFGCIRVFPPRFVAGVIDLYRALERGDQALARHAYETWGFKNLSPEVMETLNLWAHYLYAPLLDDRVRAIDEGEGTAYGAAVAGKVHAELRRLGGVKPPREFVLMDRSAIGLGSVFMHLQARLNWHALFNRLIEDFDAAALGRRQAEALAASGLAVTGDAAPAPAP